MRIVLLFLVIGISNIIQAQSVTKSVIIPIKDSVKLSGLVYQKGEVSINMNAEIASSILLVKAFVSNSGVSKHIAETEIYVEYSKTTTNSSGVSKTVIKSEKKKISDFILDVKTDISFFISEKLDVDAVYKIVSISGNIIEDKIVTLEAVANPEKIALTEKPVACGNFYDIEFFVYYKKIRVAELSQTGGSPIMNYIPYLVVENKSTKEVSFKGKADIVINIGGVQRTLKTDCLQHCQMKGKNAKSRAIYLLSIFSQLFIL
ncbi:MAG: hypothetical protein IPO21_02975 [Bacteroidales bacterium]|nr:hypothetical protein [Bacteroidales bacterium]